MCVEISERLAKTPQKWPNIIVPCEPKTLVPNLLNLRVVGNGPRLMESVFQHPRASSWPFLSIVTAISGTCCLIIQNCGWKLRRTSCMTIQASIWTETFGNVKGKRSFKHRCIFFCFASPAVSYSEYTGGQSGPFRHRTLFREECGFPSQDKHGICWGTCGIHLRLDGRMGQFFLFFPLEFEQVLQLLPHEFGLVPGCGPG